MAKKHVFAVSLLLGLATAAGALAVVQSVRLGQASSAKASANVAATNAWLAKRDRALTRAEVALRRALAKRPPKLPKVPHFAQVSAPAAPAAPPVAAAAASAAPPVRYVRAAPIVVVKHRHHGDDGGGDHEGGGDD
jgi:hypothetical protein